MDITTFNFDSLFGEDLEEQECKYTSKSIGDIFSTRPKELFVTYTPLDGVLNSDDIPSGCVFVESTPLSVVQPPRPSNEDIFFVPGNFPCKDGKLSKLQEDAVRLAASRFKQLDEMNRPLGMQISTFKKLVCTKVSFINAYV